MSSSEEAIGICCFESNTSKEVREPTILDPPSKIIEINHNQTKPKQNRFSNYEHANLQMENRITQETTTKEQEQEKEHLSAQHINSSQSQPQLRKGNSKK